MLETDFQNSWQEAYAMNLTSTMDASIQQFASCFTKPSFQTFRVIVAGWLLGGGRRTVTHVLLAGDGLKIKTFSCYHRFFSKARWTIDSMGRVIVSMVLKFIPKDTPIVAAIDDTLNRKTGKRIWAAGMHHDPILSKGKRCLFSFGHNWVVLSIQLRFAFAPDKVWSLPILMRLYRRKQKLGRPRGERKAIGQARPGEYRTRPQLASEMIAILASWLPNRTIRVVGDSAYAGKSISRNLPDSAHLTSRMVMNAALYDQPSKRRKGALGAPRKRGKRLPSPVELAKSKKVRWTKTRATLYGRRVRVWYKSCTALWYNSAGTRLLRIVVVRDPSLRRKDDCFFTTDLTLSPRAILELIAMRWPLEVAFYNAKQFLGLEDPQNRTPQAVQRTAPMALYLHTLVILWFAKHGRFNAEAYRRAHPWYVQKRTPSFADMLASLKRTSLRESISGYPGQKPPSAIKLRTLFQTLEAAA
ncbi:MAG: transposase [Planctomycetes bacterium]|nr:transposase [Planctomycetota bacterium]